METETNTSIKENNSETSLEPALPLISQGKVGIYRTYISDLFRRQNKFSATKLKTYLAALLLFLIPLFFLLFTQSQSNKFSKNITNEIIQIKKNFPETDITAKSVYIWDIEGQRKIYAKNEEDQLPLASLTKIMTALVAIDKSESFAKVKITSDSIKQEGDSGLVDEEKWALKDLIDFSLITSSNDGIYAVASAIENKNKQENPERSINSENFSDIKNENDRNNFVELMNEKAQELSLSRTFYLNETGLDSSENINGGYGSAEDMAKLFAYLIKNKPEMIESTAYSEVKITSLDNVKHTAQNTNEIIGIIPNLIASKTGYTDVSGGNLVVAFDFGLMKPIVISILGSTKEGRFEDMKKLIRASMEYLSYED